MKLNVKAFALTGAILWALSMFILTWWLIMMGAEVENPTVIGKYYYVGYSISPVGSVIGALYGFVDAGIGCLVFALLYNALVGKKQ
ncbi:MAG: hypothetical protein JW728_03610 [Candidatus Aureabacteria bacterium]|nr:hypothetical protein [Candidatus Auribacterota bacterium]